MRVEHEYERCGAWGYLTAWDVRQAKIFGTCVKKTGIALFDEFVGEVMKEKPYRRARRVFWIMDNGSSHRGDACVKRLQKHWPNIICVHTPVHASWPNQVKIYFSIIQRKVLTPNDFSCLDDVRDRLQAFEEHYEKIAKPFQWKFIRKDLSRLLSNFGEESPLAKAV